MVPQTKVFVGSLPQGSKPEELRKLFERFGVVTECDIMNRCGFVHMQSEDQAAAAIRALHNSSFNGGVITVERGRIKERGQRGGGGRGGMRGGVRNGGDRRGPGPMRGGHMGGRDAPYMRDARPGAPRDMRPPPMGMRNGMGAPYDRGMDRAPGYDDRYYGEDRRGFALMDGRRPDPYPPMYADDRRGYAAPAPLDDLAPMYGDDRRAAPPYPDERDMMDRRPPMRGAMPMGGGYDRVPQPRSGGMGNGDMYSRRSPMRGGVPPVAAYDRDPYGQQYAPMPRGGGAARGGRELGIPRRY